MTFEQLKEYVKEKYRDFCPNAAAASDHIIFGNMMFTDLGEVIFLNNTPYPYKTSPRIRKKISFDNMRLVIDGLYGDKANPG